MDTEYLSGYTLGRMGLTCPLFVSDAFRAGYLGGQEELMKKCGKWE